MSVAGQAEDPLVPNNPAGCEGAPDTGGKSNWPCCHGDGTAAGAAEAAAGAGARCLESDFEEDSMKYEAKVWLTLGAGSGIAVTDVNPLVHCWETVEAGTAALVVAAAAAAPRSRPISRLKFALASRSCSLVVRPLAVA